VNNFIIIKINIFFDDSDLLIQVNSANQNILI